MTSSMTAVLSTLAFALWTLFLVIAVLLNRGYVMVDEKAPVNAFPAGVPHGGDRYWRLNRAHLNATENVGIVAAVLLGAVVAGGSGRLLELLPPVIVVARVVQSLVHVASGSRAAVTVRVTAFVTQVLCLGAIAIETMLRIA